MFGGLDDLHTPYLHPLDSEVRERGGGEGVMVLQIDFYTFCVRLKLVTEQPTDK